MSIQVEVKGLDRFLAALDEAVVRFDDGLTGGLMDIAREVEAAAKEFVHVRTGALRDSITAEEREKLEAVIRMLYYGFFLEFGTVRMPPYPFIQPALDRVRPHVSEIVWKHLGRLFKT